MSIYVLFKVKLETMAFGIWKDKVHFQYNLHVDTEFSKKKNLHIKTIFISRLKTSYINIK